MAAGADAILIHSKSKDGLEILDFARSWTNKEVPLVAVPTTYPPSTPRSCAPRASPWPSTRTRPCGHRSPPWRKASPGSPRTDPPAASKTRSLHWEMSSSSRVDGENE
ncbi:hypothetical protein NKH18_42890 [Streptomyces sp. M10(2022)]